MHGKLAMARGSKAVRKGKSDKSFIGIAALCCCRKRNLPRQLAPIFPCLAKWKLCPVSTHVPALIFGHMNSRPGMRNLSKEVSQMRQNTADMQSMQVERSPMRRIPPQVSILRIAVHCCRVQRQQSSATRRKYLTFLKEARSEPRPKFPVGPEPPDIHID